MFCAKFTHQLKQSHRPAPQDKHNSHIDYEMATTYRPLALPYKPAAPPGSKAAAAPQIVVSTSTASCSSKSVSGTAEEKSRFVNLNGLCLPFKPTFDKKEPRPEKPACFPSPPLVLDPADQPTISATFDLQHVIDTPSGKRIYDAVLATGLLSPPWSPRTIFSNAPASPAASGMSSPSSSLGKCSRSP